MAATEARAVIKYIDNKTRPHDLIPSPNATTCPHSVDLVFLVDSSESFRTSGFDDAKLFLQNVVNYFTLGENDTRVGVVTFSNADKQVTWVRLNENYTRVELLEEISNIPYDRGSTYTGLGLDYVRNNSFLEGNGRRSSTLDFLVVLTDDVPEDDVSGPSQLIRDMGITVFVVGVGEESDISQATLETIAGDPSRVFRLTDHDELAESVRARAIGGNICNAAECPALTAPTNGALSTPATSYLTVVTFTCNPGYVLTGAVNAMCQANMTWSNTVPTCLPVECPARAAPANGAVNPTGAVSYPNSITFTCNSGYTLNGAATPTCQADGTWSSPVPTCQAVQCPALTAPANGVVSPTGAVSYPNSVTFTCNSGYTLTGATSSSCRADGSWSNSVHTCTAVQCPARAAPANGVVSPTGAVSYPNGATFTCNTGYTLNGVATPTCQADGTWSNPVPTCQAVQCTALTAPANGVVSPTGAVSYPNGVTFTCNSGYTLAGATGSTCRADGSWSNPVHTCTAVQCSVRAAPANGAVSSTGPVSYPNGVTFTCNPGYTLNGAATPTCQADRSWSSPVPTCQAVQCAGRAAPANGAVSPTGVVSYPNGVTFTCNPGYTLSGVATPTCQADTTWSHPVPTCQAVQCPARAAPANGAVSPTGAVSYPNGVTFTCDSGYTLNGVATLTCQADGTWSNPVPTCQAVQCPARAAPANGAVSPTGAVSYPNGVTFTCNPGYTLNGAATPTCQADTTWSNPVPSCTPGVEQLHEHQKSMLQGLLDGRDVFLSVRTGGGKGLCYMGFPAAARAAAELQSQDRASTNPAREGGPALTAPTNGALSPLGPHAFPTVVTFTCNPGYVRSGAADTTCRADGTRSNPVPTCTVGQCSTLTAPANGAISTTATSYNTVVTFTCNSGYVLNGATSTTCQVGTWSDPVPTCTPVQCPARAAPANGAVSPTGTVPYPNGVTFTCNTGYTLNGVTAPTCQADGTWSSPVPTCTPTLCPYPVDLVFLVDSSESFRTSGFDDAKLFLQNLVNYFTLGENDTRVGVVTFSNADKQVTWVRLNENYTRVELLEEIGNIPYDRGSTYTGLGLDYVRNNSFLEVNGRRNSTLDFLVVLTDGVPEDDIIVPAQLIRDMGITVFVVGVGEESDISQATLETIAGDPSRVFRLTDYDFLMDDSHAAPIRENICNAIQCPTLTAPANGALSTTDTAIRTTVTTTCNTGYQPSGAASTTCQADTTWSNPVPTCIPVQCSALTAPANGAVSPTGAVFYPNGATFTCNSGYTLNGAATPTCQADGTWNSPVPTCQARTCPARPAPANGAVSPTGAVSYPNGVTFTCNPGYTLDGVATPTCQADGTWFSPVPTCTRVQCPARAAPANGAVSPTGAVSYPNSVTFTCNSGYVRTGAASATCQADGTWSDPVPTCNPVQCSARAAPGNGAVSPTGAVSFPNGVTFTCNPGYTLNGVATPTCQADGTWSNPVPTCQAGNCDRLVREGWDIMFLMDSTSSVKFGSVKNLTRDIADRLLTDGGNTRVGVVQFSDNPAAIFDLNTYNTKSAVITAINAAQRRSGGTFAGSALTYVKEVSFSTANGGRAEWPDALIVVTDGMTFDDISYASQAVREQGITTFAVGAGDAVNRQALRVMAVDPYKLDVDTFDARRRKLRTLLRLASWRLVTTSSVCFYALMPSPEVSSGVADVCTRPANPANGIRRGTIYQGERMYFSCDDNFVLDGTTPLTCTGTFSSSTGSWSNTVPTCKPACTPNPCLNGGVCTPTPSGYRCQCPPGIFGRNCAYNATTPIPGLTTRQSAYIYPGPCRSLYRAVTGGHTVGTPKQARGALSLPFPRYSYKRTRRRHAQAGPCTWGRVDPLPYSHERSCRRHVPPTSSVKSDSLSYT
ncbi:hypothetical protein Bbelb_372470 [Branchiostoma belcheri]|nr:hypothetical protein Bbelb_372470 [Branchiostoma belcheri]